MQHSELYCPRCKSTEFCKAGIVLGNQRYKCKKCNYFFSKLQRKTAYSDLFKQQALNMINDGITVREVANLLNLNYSCLLKWVKQTADK